MEKKINKKIKNGGKLAIATPIIKKNSKNLSIDTPIIKKNLKKNQAEYPVNNIDVPTKNTNLTNYEIREIINYIRKYINEIHGSNNNKYVKLGITKDDKIYVFVKNDRIIEDLTEKFRKFKELNLYLISLYRNNQLKNKNIKIMRLKNECDNLNLEIIYTSRSSFFEKHPSLLIHLERFLTKIMIKKNFINLTNNNNYFTTLKSFIKTNKSLTNFGARKDNYLIRNACRP